MQNVIVGLFEVESEGFQAITELKQNPGDDKSFISQAALLKKEAGQVKVLDSFDTGVTTSDDMALGGLMGMCVGILGGPIDDNVLKILESLAEDAFHCVTKSTLGIIGDRDNG